MLTNEYFFQTAGAGCDFRSPLTLTLTLTLSPMGEGFIDLFVALLEGVGEFKNC